MNHKHLIQLNSTIKVTYLMQSNDSIIGIYKWDAQVQNFIQIIKDNQGNIFSFDTDDFNLNIGESYFIYFKNNTYLNYNNGYLSFLPKKQC